MKLVIDEDKCTGEGICIEICPKGPRIFEVREKNGRRICVILDDSYCLGCTTCISRCPRGAIRRLDKA